MENKCNNGCCEKLVKLESEISGLKIERGNLKIIMQNDQQTIQYLASEIKTLTSSFKSFSERWDDEWNRVKAQMRYDRDEQRDRLREAKKDLTKKIDSQDESIKAQGNKVENINEFKLKFEGVLGLLKWVIGGNIITIIAFFISLIT